MHLSPVDFHTTEHSWLYFYRYDRASSVTGTASRHTQLTYTSILWASSPHHHTNIWGLTSRYKSQLPIPQYGSNNFHPVIKGICIAPLSLLCVFSPYFFYPLAEVNRLLIIMTIITIASTSMMVIIRVLLCSGDTAIDGHFRRTPDYWWLARTLPSPTPSSHI